MARAFVIAQLGAESTGKTTLAAELRDALAQQGRRVEQVAEVLREFCDAQGRTPRIDEQATIAREQTTRIAAAAQRAEVVVADTTALMIAVYSDWVFGDHSLYDEALAAHARCDLTLLTALDLPWRSDGLQRDGAHVREPIDAMVRAALQRGGHGWSLASGSGPLRARRAHAAAAHALDARERSGRPNDAPRWQWVCERCGEAACEHRLPLAR
jgi:nicotinamide riboside kinase